MIVLCYDISDNPRRAKLFKALKGFLTPVQESVFEGHLPDRRWNDLLHTVKATIDADYDSVRVYSLCRSCRGQSLLIGISPAVRDPGEPILV